MSDPDSTSAPLTLVHTAQSNVEVFSSLLAELAPEVPARHLLHEALLNESLAAGEFTSELRRRTAAAMREAAELIVLAQASMAAALERCGDLGVPVLSSPRLGLEAALAAWRAAGGVG